MYKDRPEIYLVFKLRKLLDSYQYKGIVLGKILRTRIISDYWSGYYTTNPKSKIGVFFFRFYLLGKIFLNFFRVQKNSGFLNNSILIETFDIENRLKGFWHPLIQNRGKDEIVLLECNNIEKYADTYQKILFFGRSIGNPISIIKWHLQNYLDLSKNINKICQDSGLNNTSSNVIYNEILRVILIIEQFSCLFAKNRPRAFIAIDDQHVNGAIICSILNKYNIPTFTHVHGAIGIQSMVDCVPLNSKFVFCWGDYMVDLYKQNGVDSKQLLKVGCQRSNVGVKYSENEIREFKNILGIPEKNLNLPTVLFGFTRLITSNWMLDILDISNQLSQKFQFLGRLHPSSSIQDLKQFHFELNENLIISESSDLELLKHISVADFVIVDSSTMGFDALVLGKDVIILDSAIDLKTQDVMFDVIQNGACYLCRNAEEVIGIIQNKELIAKTRCNAKVFLEQYFYQFGDKAAKEIIRMVELETS
jgi:hypothetical protein